jgi:beta-mannanase
LPDIVSGKYDHYLQHYARNLARYQAPVMVSFGHEMNGTWYVWGNGHVKPAIFIAAWRRIHTEMRSAKNVIWLWNPNRLSGTVRSLEDWYPGDSYVDLIGLDGYYRGRLATFDGLFGSSLRELHRMAPHKPVILAETAVNPRDKLFAAQVNNLFRGVKRWGLTGVIWFDINAKQQWSMNVPRGREIRKAICNADQNVCSRI